MGQHERLKEEKDDQRRRAKDRTAVGQKDRWTRFAAAKKAKTRAKAYYIQTYYAKKQASADADLTRRLKEWQDA